MGILYAWATKEYLLERMSFGQIIMYLNEGLRFKYPKPTKTGGASGSTGSLIGASADEIESRRAELHKKYIEG